MVFFVIVSISKLNCSYIKLSYEILENCHKGIEYEFSLFYTNAACAKYRMKWLDLFSRFKKSSDIYKEFLTKLQINWFFLIGIHSMQDWISTTRHGVTSYKLQVTRHGVTRKKSTKRLKHTGNLFRRNLKFTGVS